MSEYVVSKYGGTSMAQPEVVASVVESDPRQKVIVVSAPGKLQGDDTKVTDLLIGYADKVYGNKEDPKEERDEIVERFVSAYSSLGERDISVLKDDLNDQLEEPTAHIFPSKDAILSIGEEFSAKFFARLTGTRYVDPQFFRFNPNGFDRSKSEKLILERDLLSQPDKIIVPGFYGYHEAGNVRYVFDRGGSDRSGAILAVALGVDYQNWTDKSGIFSGDPSVVYNPAVIPVLTRDELREGAHGGNPVLQGDTIVDLAGSNTVVNIRNTFDATAEGSLVVPSREDQEFDPENIVVAVTGRDDATQLTVRDMGMSSRVGYVESLTKKLKDAGVSLQHVPTSQDTLSIVIHDNPESDLDRLAELSKFVEGHSASANPKITVEKKGMVYLIGEGLRSAHYQQAKAIRAMQIAESLGIAIMPVIAPNSPSIAFATERGEVDNLVREIHKKEIEKL
ncbi:MAG: hypothetical protein AAB423_00515 [Patescibacteria group bacterium]